MGRIELQSCYWRKTTRGKYLRKKKKLKKYIFSGAVYENGCIINQPHVFSYNREK